MAEPTVSYLQTGIKGLDEMLGGKGIPQGYNIFALGGPGSGKTTFGLQFLYNGATALGEPGVYVSLDEALPILKTNALNFGWNFAELEKQKKVLMIDASPIRKLPGEVKIGALTLGKREFSLMSLVDILKKSVSEIGAKRLIVDPLAMFILQYPGEVERRSALFDLMDGISGLGCTTLFVNEMTESGLERKYQFEEYLAQGVITMRKIIKPEGGLIRVFSVEKMRGIDHDTQPRPYKITGEGVEVYPGEVAL